MSEIDPDQVRHVARLARLQITDEEVDRLSEELGRALARFRELEEAEVDGEEDGSGDEPGVGTRGEAPDGEPEVVGSGLRPDRPDADPLARGPGQLAPEWEDGFFLVPRLGSLGDDPGDVGGNDG